MVNRLVAVDDSDYRLPEPVVQTLSQSFSAYDVPAEAAMLGDATSVFVNSAVTSKAAGRNVLRVAPGEYTVPGLHPDDIEGLYVLGDGVKLVGTPVPNVYPFSTHEWASLAARATTGVTGRGVVAFEVDDALDIHWTRLFPLCKELGITTRTRNARRKLAPTASDDGARGPGYADPSLR